MKFVAILFVTFAVLFGVSEQQLIASSGSISASGSLPGASASAQVSVDNQLVQAVTPIIDEIKAAVASFEAKSKALIDSIKVQSAAQSSRLGLIGSQLVNVVGGLLIILANGYLAVGNALITFCSDFVGILITYGSQIYALLDEIISLDAIVGDHAAHFEEYATEVKDRVVAAFRLCEQELNEYLNEYALEFETSVNNILLLISQFNGRNLLDTLHQLAAAGVAITETAGNFVKEIVETKVQFFTTITQILVDCIGYFKQCIEEILASQVANV